MPECVGGRVLGAVVLVMSLNGCVSAGTVAAPLSVAVGDATRGRAIVASRQQGLCLLCHQAPIPEERFQGNLAPDLAGVGKRLTPAQLRERMIDSRRLQPDSIMPAYLRSSGLNRVSQAQQGKTLLTEQQLDDVVAYLSSLQ